MIFKKLSIGKRVWSVETYKMGNTTLRSVGVYEVVVTGIDPVHFRIEARWNGNEPRWYGRKTWQKWREKKPELEMTGVLGQMRLKKKGG